MRLTRLALAVALAAAVPTVHAAPAKTVHAAPANSAKARQLDALYAQYWEESLRLNPLGATYQGDNRYNDQLPDFYSAAYRKQNHDFTARWLKKIETIGSSGLSGQSLISYDIFVHDSRESLEGEKYPGWMMPVDQMGSIATNMAQLGSGTGATGPRRREPGRSVAGRLRRPGRDRFRFMGELLVGSPRQGVPGRISSAGCRGRWAGRVSGDYLATSASPPSFVRRSGARLLQGEW